MGQKLTTGFNRLSALAGLLFLVLFFSAFRSSGTPVSIRVSVKEQKLYLFKGPKVVKVYPVSTSQYGTGSIQGSNRTPLGHHRVARKIGAGVPLNTIFRERANTRRTIAPNPAKKPVSGDYITTRILWLEGLEPGKNRGAGVDSFERCIYIHGTPDEGLIGTPASHGCIRMKNKDVAELFNFVPYGTPVWIV